MNRNRKSLSETTQAYLEVQDSLSTWKMLTMGIVILILVIAGEVFLSRTIWTEVNRNHPMVGANE